LLADIGDHSPVVCSTQGATALTFVAGSEESYFLTVPNNGVAEGSYGRASSGAPRQRRPNACYPQHDGACD